VEHSRHNEDCCFCSPRHSRPRFSCSSTDSHPKDCHHLTRTRSIRWRIRLWRTRIWNRIQQRRIRCWTRIWWTTFRKRIWCTTTDCCQEDCHHQSRLNGPQSVSLSIGHNFESLTRNFDKFLNLDRRRRFFQYPRVIQAL
ncbi:hypothetical protein V3C99_006372, partial [Haemonchus contortus]|uniref:Ovule protein n=1 Tax=Haemonchus contortus TaxID=6289 RepID=A0A7I4XTJ2_HAECO